MYHQGYKPTAAETVIIQMVLAYCKMVVGNKAFNHSPDMPPLYYSSFPHYHYCLSMANDLTNSRTTADFQALALLVMFCRQLPTPGAAWGLSSWVINIAVETGYHRSASAWHDDAAKPDQLQIELRKRVFWVLMMMNVSIGGRLGRPMPLRFEDYDVEFPELIDDRLPSEMDRPERKSCSIDLGVEMMKMTELFLSAYNCVYALRPTSDYERDVGELDARASKWRANLPPQYDLGSPESEKAPMVVAALWAHYWYAEFRLVLHHPALCRSSNPSTISKNLGICMEAAFAIIHCSARIHAHNSLDTTWVNATLYIAAIFTLLFAYWEKRHEISSEDVKKLENQIDVCFDMMNIIGAPGRMFYSICCTMCHRD